MALLGRTIQDDDETIMKLLIATCKISLNSIFQDNYPYRPGYTLSSFAAECGFKAIVTLLLETGKVDVDCKDQKSKTPLHLAAMHVRGYEVAKLLLDTGKVDIDSKDWAGKTPVYHASSCGSLDTVMCLFESSANIHEAASNGSTPLHSASKRGHLNIVKFLYESGADAGIHLATNDGGTPLYLASKNGH